jgi:hypothetical protein
VIDVAAGRRHRFRARADGHGLRLFAADAVRIVQDEPRLVRGVRFQIQDAAGEHVGYDDVHAAAGAPDALALQPEERQRRLPLRHALFSERHLHRGVAVVIALDVPLEPEIDQRRRIDNEFAGFHRVALGWCCQCPGRA